MPIRLPLFVILAAPVVALAADNWPEFRGPHGDGHADVLLTEQDVFTWHQSLAEEGFGQARSVRQPTDEERGPRLVLADGTQSVYLADMCGDGLTDLVRVRNGEVFNGADDNASGVAALLAVAQRISANKPQHSVFRK